MLAPCHARCERNKRTSHFMFNALVADNKQLKHPGTGEFSAGKNDWPSQNKSSPAMRAQRAKLKSRRDDMIIAPGKRSAARGCGPRMISSFFTSGLARPRRAKPEEKKEVGWGVSLLRAAASAALPWAGMWLPFPGAVRVSLIDTNPTPAFTRSSRNAASSKRLLPAWQAPRHEAEEFGVATPLEVGQRHGLKQSKSVRKRHLDTHRARGPEE